MGNKQGGQKQQATEENAHDVGAKSRAQGGGAESRTQQPQPAASPSAPTNGTNGPKGGDTRGVTNGRDGNSKHGDGSGGRSGEAGGSHANGNAGTQVEAATPNAEAKAAQAEAEAKAEAEAEAKAQAEAERKKQEAAEREAREKAERKRQRAKEREAERKRMQKERERQLAEERRRQEHERIVREEMHQASPSLASPGTGMGSFRSSSGRGSEQRAASSRRVQQSTPSKTPSSSTPGVKAFAGTMQFSAQQTAGSSPATSGFDNERFRKANSKAVAQSTRGFRPTFAGRQAAYNGNTFSLHAVSHQARPPPHAFDTPSPTQRHSAGAGGAGGGVPSQQATTPPSARPETDYMQATPASETVLTADEEDLMNDILNDDL